MIRSCDLLVFDAPESAGNPKRRKSAAPEIQNAWNPRVSYRTDGGLMAAASSCTGLGTVWGRGSMRWTSEKALAHISHTLTVRPPLARFFPSRVAVTARIQARERPMECRRVRFCERSGALRGQAALFGHETASRERERDRISRATVAWRISRGRVWPGPGARWSGTDDCWPC